MPKGEKYKDDEQYPKCRACGMFIGFEDITNHVSSCKATKKQKALVAANKYEMVSGKDRNILEGFCTAEDYENKSKSSTRKHGKHRDGEEKREISNEENEEPKSPRNNDSERTMDEEEAHRKRKEERKKRKEAEAAEEARLAEIEEEERKKRKEERRKRKEAEEESKSPIEEISCERTVDEEEARRLRKEERKKRKEAELLHLQEVADSKFGQDEETEAERRRQKEEERQKRRAARDVPIADSNRIVFVCTVCHKQLTEQEGYEHVTICTPPPSHRGPQLEPYKAEGEKETEEKLMICNVCGKCIEEDQCISHLAICTTPKRFTGQRFLPIESTKKEEKVAEDVIITAAVAVPITIAVVSTPIKETRKETPVNTPVIEESPEEESPEEDVFAVDKEVVSVSPIELAIAFNPFEEDEEEPSKFEKRSVETETKPIVPAKVLVNPFGSEETIGNKEMASSPKSSTKPVVNPFNALAEDDKSNPFSEKPADVPANPFDAPSEEEEEEEVNPFAKKPAVANPFDAPSEEEEEGVNPFAEKPAVVNPFDAPSEDEEEGVNPFAEPIEKAEPSKVVTSTLNPFDADDELLQTVVPEVNLFSNVVITPSLEPAQQITENAGLTEEEEKQITSMRCEEEILKQELVLKEKEAWLLQEKEKEEEEEKEQKRREEMEALMEQRKEFERQEMDRIRFEESIRVGYNCKKWCSNGKYHETCVKLIVDGDEKKIQWNRKRSIFHGALGFVDVNEVISIEDVDGTSIFALKTESRELRLEFISQSAKLSVINGLRVMFPNLS